MPELDERTQRPKAGLFSTDPKRYRLDPHHQRILTEMLHADEFPEVMRLYFEELVRRVSPQTVRALRIASPPEQQREAAQALARGDLADYVRHMKSIAKGLAEAGIPFHEMETLGQAFEEVIIPFLVKNYRESDQLRLALEARQRLLQIEILAAAEAYHEVALVTAFQLQEDLREATSRTDVGQRAVLTVAKKLGLDGLLPLLLSHEYVKDAPYPGKLEKVGEQFVHTGPHLCEYECEGTLGECLTAYVAQAALEQRERGVMRVDKVEVFPDRTCEVWLSPLFGSETER